MSKFQPDKTFEVDQLVHVYGYDQGGHEFFNGETVSIDELDGYTASVSDKDGTYLVHVKQLRRIKFKPKPKPEARVGKEWTGMWDTLTYPGKHSNINTVAFCPNGSYKDFRKMSGQHIKLREVLPGSITLSREQLEEAYKKAKDLWLVDKSDVLLFDVFLRLLGFNPSGESMTVHKVFLSLEEGPFQFPTECGTTGATTEEENLSWSKVNCEDCLAKKPKRKTP